MYIIMILFIIKFISYNYYYKSLNSKVLNKIINQLFYLVMNIIFKDYLDL